MLGASIAALINSYAEEVYKNGAVVLHLDLNHPDIVEFIECPRSEIPWAKRCINVTQQWWMTLTAQLVN